jgi:pilus assembly protein CpaB
MRILSLLVLVFGIALAGGGVFFASKYFKEMKASMAQQGPETVRVLVAKKALGYGAKVTSDTLQWVEWPKAAVPPGAFTAVEALLGEKGDQHRVVLRAIEPGEPILETKITKFGESPRMARNLGEGKRAVSISVDAVSGVAGFVAPGDRVDILLTRSAEGQLLSSVILQGITVIAVDQDQYTGSAITRVGRTVTVEVDTRQAQKLAVAQQIGNLSLTLRGIDEAVGTEMTTVTADELSGLPKKEVDPGRQVRVRRAGSLQDVKIDDNAADGATTDAGAGAPTTGN